MENFGPLEFECVMGVGSEVIEDQMWSPFQQTYPFDDDRKTTNSLLKSAVDGNINENYFVTENEEDDMPTAFAIPIVNNAMEEVELESSEVCGTSVEAIKPKRCSIATMRIIKPPVGWKFPEVKCLEGEKHRSKTNCCVVGCGYSPHKCPRGVRFHSFPGKPYEKERKDMWIAAINRVNPDGTPWLPTKHSKVCSAHFVGGVVSNIASHPSYVPSIFPLLRKDAGKSSRKSLMYKGKVKHSDTGQIKYAS